MEKQKQIETLFVIVLGLVALYWLNRWNGWLVAAFAIGVLSLVAPVFGRLVHRAWMGLAMLMGEVTGRILLTGVYLFILLPLSLVARRAGRSGIRSTAGGRSYFTERNHAYDKEDLKNPW
jgi:hypothetical protein